MPSQARPADPTRFLVFALNLNDSGHVALDRWGLVPRSFGVFDFHHTPPGPPRLEALLDRIRRAIKRFRPAQVILGTIACIGSNQRNLLAPVRRSLKQLRVRYVTRTIEPARRLFLSAPGRPRTRGELGEQLSRSFFPELASHVVSGLERHESRALYWRRAWHALALGLQLMAERHPRQAFALMRRDVGEYGALVAESDRRLHPL